jgi:hypothetical protein
VEDVDNYGRLADDMNPCNQRWSKSNQKFHTVQHPLVWNEDGSSNMPIAHGMLLALFSCILEVSFLRGLSQADARLSQASIRQH